MISSFIIAILIGLFWIRGFWLATSPGMVLSFIPAWNAKLGKNNIKRLRYLRARSVAPFGSNGYDQHFGFIMPWRRRFVRAAKLVKFKKALTKPLFSCIYCMSSVHGTAVFFGIQPVFGESWPAYFLILYIVSLAGAVELSVTLLDH